MRKIVLLAICLFAFYNVKAQYIGVKAGYNYATLKGDVSSEASFKPYHGYYAGVTLEFPLSKLFSLQIEGIYNRATLALDYISAPVMARFNVGKGINLHVGPQIEYRVDQPNFYFNGTEPVTRVKSDAIDIIDVAMTAGIGYTTDAGGFFEIRWVQGLTNIFEGDEASLISTGIANSYDFKNRTLSMGVGYQF